MDAKGFSTKLLVLQKFMKLTEQHRIDLYVQQVKPSISYFTTKFSNRNIINNLQHQNDFMCISVWAWRTKCLCENVVIVFDRNVKFLSD